jgi:hypothetical protein
MKSPKRPEKVVSYSALFGQRKQNEDENVLYQFLTIIFGLMAFLLRVIP